jgi:hypothetical protein
MLRERKRKDTHGIRPQKYRAWFAEGDGTRLPEPVNALPRRMQDCWADIALHDQQAYGDWRQAHLGPGPPAGAETEALDERRKKGNPTRKAAQRIPARFATSGHAPRGSAWTAYESASTS